jgi:hypothetical protein
MSRFYRRTRPRCGDNLQAGLIAGSLATVAAGVSFYLVRLFLAREPLEPLPPASSRKEPAGDSRGNEA